MVLLSDRRSGRPKIDSYLIVLASLEKSLDSPLGNATEMAGGPLKPGFGLSGAVRLLD